MCVLKDIRCLLHPSLYEISRTAGVMSLASYQLARHVSDQSRGILLRGETMSPVFFIASTPKAAPASMTAPVEITKSYDLTHGIYQFIRLRLSRWLSFIRSTAQSRAQPVRVGNLSFANSFKQLSVLPRLRAYHCVRNIVIGWLVVAVGAGFLAVG